MNQSPSMATRVSTVTWDRHTNLTFVFLNIIVSYNQLKFLCWFVNISTTQNLQSGKLVDAVMTVPILLWDAINQTWGLWALCSLEHPADYRRHQKGIQNSETYRKHYPHLDIKSVYYRCIFMFWKEGSRMNTCWDGLKVGHFFLSTELKWNQNSACILCFFLSWHQPVFQSLVVVFCCIVILLICPLCCCKSQTSMALLRATLLILYIYYL